jgi:hypothetical protein
MYETCFMTKKEKKKNVPNGFEDEGENKDKN